jgi:hypothetical protein
MKKAKFANLLTKTILASSIIYVEQSIAAPCVYSFDSQTIGPNIVCSSTNATETPFTSFVSTLKFNGTVTVPANAIPITNTGVNGMSILGGNVNFTKAVSVTDVLATTSATGVLIQQGNTTMAEGITISNANAPLTSGMEIRGDNATPTSFNIASITASNNDAYGLWINNKITSGIISGAVNISDTNRNSRNTNPVYGVLVELSATPIFNGAVTLKNNQIAAGSKLGLGIGIGINSNAYAKFNSDVTITVPPFVATSNTTGIQVTNAKADFATVKTENHKVHIGVDNSTVVISGPLTILEAWSLGPSKKGVKASNAGNLSLKSTVDIIGGVTDGVDISGTNTLVTFAKAVNILDNYNAINIFNNGKAVFSDSVIINRFNDIITNSQGISISSASGQFDGAVSISNMENKALNIQGASPVFNNTLTLVDNKTGIYVDGTSVPVFNKSVTTNNTIKAGIFNSNNDVKISGANAKVNFLGAISLNNSLTGISLDTSANPTFAGITITQDLGPTGNTKLLPTDGILFTTASTGKFNGAVTISNMTNRALNIQSASPVFNDTINLADNKTGIYIDGTSTPVFQAVLSNNKIVSGVFNSNNEIKISGANAKASFTGPININNSLIGISLDTNANPTLGSVINITQDLSASGNTKLLPTDGILFTSGATGKIDSFVIISNMTNRALNIQNSSPVFNNVIQVNDNKNDIYINGTSVPVFNKSITSNNKIVSGVFNSNNSIKVSGANAKASFVEGVFITNSLTGISLDTSANPTFAGINITQDLSASGNTKLLPTDGILFTTSSTGKFDGAVTISNMTNKALNIQDSSPVFNNVIQLYDNKNDIYVDGTSAPVFNSNISSGNKIVSGVFNTDKSIQISGANAKANFLGSVSINNSLTGISIENKANPTFAGIDITQDLSGSGNTKLLPTDGILITGASTGKFDGILQISNMTNTGLNIQNSSPVFNKLILIGDNKTGISISQGSDVTFVDGISGWYDSTISSKNTIGLHLLNSKVNFKSANIKDHEINILADNSTMLFNEVLSVSDYGLNATPKTGIKLINASNATFNGTVNVNIIGSDPTVAAPLSTGIDISGPNTIGTFKGLVRSRNTYSAINISNGGKGIFSGTVSVSRPNLSLTNLQAINISSADADFSGGITIAGMDLTGINISQSSPSFGVISIANSKQGILVNDNSAPIFVGNIDIIKYLIDPVSFDESQTYGIKIDNKSTPTFNGNIATTNVNKGIIIDLNSSAIFDGNIIMDDQRNFALPSNGISLDNTSRALMSKDITLTNLNGYGLRLSNNSTATVKGVLTASKIVDKALYVGIGSKITLEQAAVFTDNGTAMQFDNTSTVNSFAEIVNLKNNKYDIDINNTTVNFVKAVSSNNTITSGNFVNYNSIKLSGLTQKLHSQAL